MEVSIRILMVTQRMTLKEFEGYLERMPQKYKKYTESINLEMAESLKRRIVTRLNPSSFFSIGYLKKSIKVKVMPKTTQVVGPRYWKAVNAGKGPKVAIPLQFLEQHMTHPERPGEYVDDPIWVNTDLAPLKFDANKGFVDRAQESFKKDAEKIINRGFIKATTK